MKLDTQIESREKDEVRGYTKNLYYVISEKDSEQRDEVVNALLNLGFDK